VQPKPTKALQLQIANDNNNNNKNFTTKTCGHKTCEVYRQQTQPPPQKPTKLIYGITANNKNPTKLLKLNLLDAKFRASADMKNKTPQNINNTL
jgi:hypothetical protein